METKPPSRVNWAQLSTETQEERRHGKRIKLRYEIVASLTDPEGNNVSIRTFTRDVSHNGCCFELDRRLPVGETVKLKVWRRDANGNAECTVAMPFRVAWSQFEHGTWIVGAEMSELERPWGVQFPKPSPHKTHD
jgi:hypothetical protein